MSRQFKEFKIEDVLDWQPQIEIDPLKLRDLSITSNTKYPFYGQATKNGGIIGYYSLTEKVLNNKNGKPTILVHSNNQNIVYLESPFYLKDGHGATSVLQTDFLNLKSALYIITAIRKAIEIRFTYNAKATKIALKNTNIFLPITSNDSIDYTYMEERISELEEEHISELEEERISELEVYLEVAGLNDYILTVEEQKAIDMFNNGSTMISEFKVKDLFEVKSNPQLNKDSFIFAKDKEECYPYFTRTEENNGICGYVNYLDDEHKITGNSIAVGMLGMRFFYMKSDFYAGQFTKTIYPKFKMFNDKIAQYFIVLLNKNKNVYQGHLVRDFENLFDNTILSLPTKNNQPDFDFMETFIKATQKLVIKEVVNWKDEIISKTKSVVRKY